MSLETAVQPVHDIDPHRSCPCNPHDIPHGLSGEIAHPDPDRIAAGKPHTPVVSHVFAGPGLYGGPEAGGQWAFQAEGTASAFTVREYISQDVGGLATKYFS